MPTLSTFSLPPARPEKKLHQLVLGLIQGRLGRRTCISIREIQDETGYTDRAIKGAVKDLVEQYRWRIGSSRETGNGGYFMIADAEDVKLATRSYRAEMRSLMRRVQVIEQVSARDLVEQEAAQLELFEKSELARVPDDSRVAA